MSGWNQKLVSKMVSGIFMLNFIQPLQAGEQDIDPELLEFIGDWETEEGKWIDPEQLEEGKIEDEQHEETTE